jgi:hypothetical protein
MPKKRPIEERFWEKVDKLGEDECWIWLGATIQPGGGRHVKPQIYGKIAGPRTPAGRVFGLLILSWILKHGDIPHGMLVDHKCHNTLCVNPSHLRLVTPKQNSENREGPLSQGIHLERGVRWNPQVGKWHALQPQREAHCVGFFDDLEEAAEAARRARNKVFTHNDADRY